MKVYEIKYYNWMRFGIYPGYKNLVFETEDEARRAVRNELTRLISLIEAAGWEVIDDDYYSDFIYNGGHTFGCWHEISAQKEGEENYGRIWILEQEGSELEF